MACYFEEGVGLWSGDRLLREPSRVGVPPWDDLSDPIEAGIDTLPAKTMDAAGNEVHEVVDDRVLGHRAEVVSSAFIVRTLPLQPWHPPRRVDPTGLCLLWCDALRLDLPLRGGQESCFGYHNVGVCFATDGFFRDHAQELLG